MHLEWVWRRLRVTITVLAGLENVVGLREGVQGAGGVCSVGWTTGELERRREHRAMLWGRAGLASRLELKTGVPLRMRSCSRPAEAVSIGVGAMANAFSRVEEK